MTKRSAIPAMAVGLFVAWMLAGVGACAESEKRPSVSVKAEIYQTTRDGLRTGEKLLGVEGKTQPLVPERVKACEIEIVRKALNDSGAKLLNSPILTTVSSEPVKMPIKTEASSEQSKESLVQLIPRVNADKSVTISFLFSVPQGLSALAVAAGMKLAAGESVLCHNIDEATGAARLVIVAPAVL